MNTYTVMTTYGDVYVELVQARTHLEAILFAIEQENDKPELARHLVAKIIAQACPRVQD